MKLWFRRVPDRLTVAIRLFGRANTIYALPSGTVTWLSANPSLSTGTVAGPRIVFASGARVLAQTY